MSLTDISKRLNMNKTTVFRLLHTLEEAKYIVKRDKYYELHSRVSTTGSASDRSVHWSVSQILQQLGTSTGRDVFVGILHEDGVISRKVYDAQAEQMVNVDSIGLHPMHQTALGKVFLAHMAAEDRLQYISRLALGKEAEKAFMEVDLLLCHLDVIKQQQFAGDYQDFIEGIHCIASPVFKAGEVIASISIADSIENMPKKIVKGLTRHVIEASQKVTQELNRCSNC
ncbi:hypothetical protein BBD42_24615 [Paenibacillus sp. BIHB 4019]|uniref:IclR-ED domain-containing protein n=1 Tax=Paenibacillus sp. BIHB 4019 TaxID=1870819 RepID=A0A1B2DNN9_9BACL|nr:IclR family transcriptional regulator [Paenibacillus sp. BIHB 4019]ANY69312.1 hypothetical protein BBD42_24615 [Paenibacillus sp. BIHB 4019]